MAYNVACYYIQNCLGVGTDTPTEGLVVSTGALRVTSQAFDFSAGTRGISIDTTAGNLGRIYTVSGTGTATDLAFGTNNSERLRITTGGNVGISTTSPNSRLHILTSGTSNYNAGANRGLLITDSAGARVILENSSATVCDNHRVWTMKNDFGRLSFGLLTDSGAAWVNENILTMVCTGNVGIGTTSITASRLRVEGATSENNSIADFISNDTSSPSTYHRGIRVLAPSLPTGDKILMSVGVADNSRNMGQLYFNYVGDQSTSNFLSLGLFAVDEVLNITGAGRVGIGTTSPSSKLDVSGADGRIQSRVDSSDGSTINIRPNAGKCGWISYTEDAVADRWGIGVKNGDAKLYFASGNVGSGGGTTRMVLDGSGNVGIGITSPSYQLHVNGTFYAAGSSQDYKEGICQYNTDSCLFMCLKPKAYQYKEEWKHLGKDLKSGTQIGLIAEEVAESHPELAVLVNEEDNQVVRNVDYEKLSIILLAEVQKLRQEVDELKQK